MCQLVLKTCRFIKSGDGVGVCSVTVMIGLRGGGARRLCPDDWELLTIFGGSTYL
jgi:hypothetical protein